MSRRSSPAFGGDPTSGQTEPSSLKPRAAQPQDVFAAMDGVATLSPDALRASLGSVSDAILRSLLLRGLSLLGHTKPSDAVVSQVNLAVLQTQRSSKPANIAGRRLTATEAAEESRIVLNSDLHPLGKDLWCAVLQFLPLYRQDCHVPAVSRSFFKLTHYYPAAWYSFNPEPRVPPRRPLNKDTLRLVRLANLDQSLLASHGPHLKRLADLAIAANSALPVSLPAFPHLQTLSLDCQFSPHPRPPSPLFTGSPLLRQVSLRNVRLSPEDVVLLAALTELESLELVVDADCEAVDLSPLSACKRLQSLTFQAWPDKVPLHRLALPASASLTALDISDTIAISHRLSECPALQSLTLRRCTSLPDCKPTKLTRLSLAGCPLYGLSGLPPTLQEFCTDRLENLKDLSWLCERLRTCCPSLRQLAFGFLAFPLLSPPLAVAAPARRQKQKPQVENTEASAAAEKQGVRCWVVDFSQSSRSKVAGRRDKALFLSLAAAQAFALELKHVAADQRWRNFEVGSIVDARDNQGTWYLSEVKCIQDDKIQVRFLGWSSKWDEWIPRDSKDRFAPKFTYFRAAPSYRPAGAPRFSVLEGLLQCPEAVSLLRRGCSLVGDW